MTKQEAIQQFKNDELPCIFMQYGRKDKSALNEAWNNFTDYLYRQRHITEHQYNTWVTPKFSKDDWLASADRTLEEEYG